VKEVPLASKTALANDQEIEQHPHCGAFLFNGRLGSGKSFVCGRLLDMINPSVIIQVEIPHH
jgi:hypothetical protein